MTCRKKVMWVTGGTKGLGLDITEYFCEKGWHVIASYGSDEDAAASLRIKAEERRYSLDVIKADVRAMSSLAAIEDRLNIIGVVDALINNAGAGLYGNTDIVSADEFSNIIDVNLTGKYRCIKTALPYLEKAEYPSVINIASKAGTEASPDLAAYCSGAAGIIMMTKCMAQDFAGSKIRVNCISPSMIDKGMSDKWFSFQFMKTYAQRNPTGRLCETKDVINCIDWLCNRQSEYVNGANILITGGQ